MYGVCKNYNIKKQNKKQTVNITRKEGQTGSASDLVGNFNAQMPRYRRHIFNVKNQQKYSEFKSGAECIWMFNTRRLCRKLRW